MFHFIYLKGTTQFNIDPIWSIAVANFQLLLSLVGLYIHRRLNYIKPLYTKMIKLQNLHMSKYLCPTSNVCRVHVSIGFVSVCVCVLTQACEGKFFCASVVSGDGGGCRSRGPRSAVCRLPSLSCGWVGVCGHVGPVCGNPALLTSHTLFSRSYKPLMPQKMLSLLWPGTAEGGGRPMERRQAREERSSQTWAWYRCFGYRPTFSLLPSTLLPSSTILSASMLFPLLSSPVLSRLCSPVLPTPLLFFPLLSSLILAT